MYFDTAPGQVFRPPSEANSFILRVTIGCSHNRCTYCNMYRDVEFRTRSMEEIIYQIEQAKHYKEHIRRIFLADGNALILHTERLLEILTLLTAAFPRLQRVACYAGPQDILRKPPEDLEKLCKAGLKMVYYGMESGDDSVLAHVRKGVNGAQSVAAGQKIAASGMKLSLMVILGLAGKKGSGRHAVNTAKAVSAIAPNMLSALTLMMHRGSELRAEYERGEFELLSPVELMGELYAMMSGIELPAGRHCLFRSNHVSNYSSFAATLPQDKARLLADIKTAESKLAGLQHWDPYNQTGF